MVNVELIFFGLPMLSTLSQKVRVCEKEKLKVKNKRTRKNNVLYVEVGSMWSCTFVVQLQEALGFT
jgi:hypothetical protein